MSNAVRPPAAHPAISAETARALLRAQHPDLAHETIGARHEGWDMAMFRLGETRAVRMPRFNGAVVSLRQETRWLRELSGGWDFPHPQVVRLGEPGEGYPWPWTVVTWLPGDICAEVPLAASAGPVVGRALVQIHVPAPPDAPINSDESVPVVARAMELIRPFRKLLAMRGPGGEIFDAQAAQQLWDEGVSAPAGPDEVLSHADLHGFNVLSRGGEFAGIVDWADLARCDRSVDLGFLHTLMPRAGVDAALEEYGRLTGTVDDAMVARARAVGLSRCAPMAASTDSVASKMGWRGLDALGVTISGPASPE